MTPRFDTARIGDNDIHYHLADSTDPWRKGESAPPTLLLFPLLRQVQAPVLLICGDKCTESRKKIMTEMRDAIPTAQLVYLDGFDYGIHYVAPDKVVPVVRKFLRTFFPIPVNAERESL